MEDLGSININIRDLGGGATAGSSGGGGQGVDEPAPKRAMRKPKTAEQRTQEAMERLTRIQQKNYEKAVTPALKRGQLLGELGGLAQRPSLGGAMSLLTPGTQTAAMLAKLGPMAGIAAAGLVAVAAGAGAVVGTIKLLNAAADHTANRIASLGNVSMKMALANANMELLKFTYQMQDAAKNEAIYEQFAKTNLQYESAKNKLTIAWNGIVAKIADDWMNLLIPATEALAATFEWASNHFDTIWGVTKDIVGSTVFGAIAWNLMKTMSFAERIARNTDPKIVPTDINEWFLADVKAMTGRGYHAAPHTGNTRGVHP